MVRQKADIMLIMGNDGGKNIDNTGTYRHIYWYTYWNVEYKTAQICGYN